MKGNAKKLAVLVGVPLIALIMTVVTASAGHPGHPIPYGFKGLYAATGFSTCSVTVLVYPSSFGSGVMEADYTFNRDGTGSAEGTIHNIDLISVGTTAASAMTFAMEFTYTVTRGGRIEFAYPEHALTVYLPDGKSSFTWNGGPTHGVVSPDHKTITITCGPPAFLTVDSSNGGPPVGTRGDCITTLVGIRIPDIEED